MEKICLYQERMPFITLTPNPNTLIKQRCYLGFLHLTKGNALNPKAHNGRNKKYIKDAI